MGQLSFLATAAIRRSLSSLCMLVMHMYLCVFLMHKYLCMIVMHMYLCVFLMHKYLCVFLMHKYLCMLVMHTYICTFLIYLCMPVMHTIYVHFWSTSTWSVRKVSDLWPGKRNWLTWSVGHLITLKVVPLGLHTLLPAVPPLLEACRKSLFRNGV
jgi:hypothetical protein